jgi:hypothetical protein
MRKFVNKNQSEATMAMSLIDNFLSQMFDFPLKNDTVVPAKGHVPVLCVYSSVNGQVKLMGRYVCNMLNTNTLQL